MPNGQSALLAWARAQGLLPEEPLGPLPTRGLTGMPGMSELEPPVFGAPEAPSMAPQPFGGGGRLAGLMAALSQFQAPPLPPVRRGEKRQGERFLYGLLSSLPQGLVASWLAQQQREGAAREETNKAIARSAAATLARHKWEQQRLETRIGAAREERKEQREERRHAETLVAKAAELPTRVPIKIGGKTYGEPISGYLTRTAPAKPEKPAGPEIDIARDRARAPFTARIERLRAEQRIIESRPSPKTAAGYPDVPRERAQFEADSKKLAALADSIASYGLQAVEAEEKAVAAIFRRSGSQPDTLGALSAIQTRKRVIQAIRNATQQTLGALEIPPELVDDAEIKTLVAAKQASFGMPRWGVDANR